MTTFDTTFTDDVPKHSRTTKLFHAGLALTIIAQLASSQFMDPDEGGDWIFQVHQYSGLIATVMVVGLWITTMARVRGTPLSMLVPWFSGARLSALWDDIKLHLSSLKRLQMPHYVAHAPFAAAVHGLGLLLMTAMAASGTLYYFVTTGDPDGPGLVHLAMLVHTTLANLVWAYLIAHAGVAFIHHFTQHMSLSEMWSFRKNPKG